jgi:signal transduction histidine kinase
MRAADRLVGMLAFDDAGVERVFTERDRELAGAVAKLAGLVVERERLLAEREAARANELALREANRRMDAFLGIASHELRTPMTVIKMNTQLAEQQLHRLAEHAPAPGGPIPRPLANALHLLEQAARQIKRQERLVGDLLEVSRIQAGTFELLPEPCDLAKIVCEAVAEQRLSNPGRTITLAGAGEPVPMVADPDRIGQVVTNYLTNALKYSPAAAPIAVTIRRDAGATTATVEVRDEGPGIPPEERERIWRRFHRAPGIGVLSGSGVGLGLGLHISREIVERHGGAVGLRSAPGEGSTFWFTLPVVHQ